LPDTFGLGGKLTLRCVRSIAAHTLITAAPLLVAWPDLIVAGLPNDTAHCQSPRSSRTTVYSIPRYSIDRPIGKGNLPSPTPPQWSILLALRKLNGQRPITREWRRPLSVAAYRLTEESASAALWLASPSTRVPRRRMPRTMTKAAIDYLKASGATAISVHAIRLRWPRRMDAHRWFLGERPRFIQEVER
jgi:hypothetical protein